MRRDLAVALVVAVAVSGCGGSTANDPKSVAAAFGSAIAHSDWSKACSLMTSDAKGELLKVAVATGGNVGSCANEWKAVLGYLDQADRDKLKGMHLVSIKVTGDTAVAHYSSDQPGDSGTSLVKKGGHWLVDKDNSG